MLVRDLLLEDLLKLLHLLDLVLVEEVIVHHVALLDVRDDDAAALISVSVMALETYAFISMSWSTTIRARLLLEDPAILLGLVRRWEHDVTIVQLRTVATRTAGPDTGGGRRSNRGEVLCSDSCYFGKKRS